MQGTAVPQIAEFIAVLACALFTGAAVYITFIEHPARMQCGVELAATEFAPSYRRATVMQATCAAGGLLSSVAAWVSGASFSWLVAGLLLGSVNKRAGIHDDDISVFGVRRDLRSVPRQQPHHDLAVNQVLRAAEADKADFRGSARPWILRFNALGRLGHEG